MQLYTFGSKRYRTIIYENNIRKMSRPNYTIADNRKLIGLMFIFYNFFQNFNLCSIHSRCINPRNDASGAAKLSNRLGGKIYANGLTWWIDSLKIADCTLLKAQKFWARADLIFVSKSVGEIKLTGGLGFDKCFL